MEILKKILFSCIAAFLLYQAISLVQGLLQTSPSECGLGLSIFLGFLLSLFLTGVFAFPSFVFPISKILPKKYYTIKNPQRLKNIYKVLGLRYFRYLLLAFFWGKSKNKKKFFDGTRTGLQNFIFQSHQAEFGHLGPFIVITLVSILLWVYGFNTLVAVTMLFNIIGNLYPIILQRYHRIRIGRLADRFGH